MLWYWVPKHELLHQQDLAKTTEQGLRQSLDQQQRVVSELVAKLERSEDLYRDLTQKFLEYKSQTTIDHDLFEEVALKNKEDFEWLSPKPAEEEVSAS
jgi:hypothetical protein